jgi:DHA1 family multidrug resistance protein-like MFS transporter
MGLDAPGAAVNTGRRNLFVVFFSNLVASTGMAGFLPAFPIILSKLGMTDAGEISLWTGVLTAAAPFSAALAGPVWGAVGDRIGRKWMVLRALAGLTVFVGLMSFASDPWTLLALRLGQGVFSGFIAPSLTLVSVHTSPSRQGFVAAVLQTALLAGGVAGPPVGGWLLDRCPPGILFGVAAGAAAVSAVLVALYASDPFEPRLATKIGGPFDALRHAFDDVKVVLREPAVRRLLVALFAVRFGTSAVEPLFAVYVKTFEASSAFVAENLGLANGALVAATPLGNLLALPAWGRAGDRRGHLFAFTLAAAGAGAFYAPQAVVNTPVALFAVRFLAGVFLAGVIPSAYGLVASETPLQHRGGAYSLTFSAIALANSAAPMSGGFLVSRGVGIRPLLLASAIPLVGAALWMVLRGRRGR